MSSEQNDTADNTDKEPTADTEPTKDFWIRYGRDIARLEQLEQLEKQAASTEEPEIESFRISGTDTIQTDTKTKTRAKDDNTTSGGWFTF